MERERSGKKLVVVQRVGEWLPVQMNWLYSELAYLPGGIRSVVACNEAMNLERFSVGPVSCLSRERRRWQLGPGPVRRWRGRRWLEEVCRAAGAGVLHSHFGFMGWEGMPVARRLGLRHVVTFYGMDVNHFPQADSQWLGRYGELFGEVDAVLCEGPHMGRCIVELGCPAEKVRVHHLGVRVEEIEYRPRQWRPGEALRVLIAASFREKKGIPYAVEALGRLAATGVEVELTIIGDALPGVQSVREKERILAAVAASGLERVRMPGVLGYEAMMGEAYGHHVYMAASVTAADGDTEGGAPVAILDMAASGMPVVGTRHCDIPELVEDGVSGLLAEERDVEGLAERLRWLVEHPQAWEAMAAAGRRRVEEQFDARRQGERLGEVYWGLGVRG